MDYKMALDEIKLQDVTIEKLSIELYNLRGLSNDITNYLTYLSMIADTYAASTDPFDMAKASTLDSVIASLSDILIKHKP